MYLLQEPRQPGLEFCYRDVFAFSSPDPVVAPAKPGYYLEINQIVVSALMAGLSDHTEKPIVTLVFNDASVFFDVCVGILFSDADNISGINNLNFPVPFRSPELTGHITMTVSNLVSAGDQIEIMILGQYVPTGVTA